MVPSNGGLHGGEASAPEAFHCEQNRGEGGDRREISAPEISGACATVAHAGGAQGA